MIALARMNNKHVDQRFDALRAEFGAQLGAEISSVRTELGEVKAAVAKLDARVYDLTTGRHTPLIVPGH